MDNEQTNKQEDEVENENKSFSDFNFHKDLQKGIDEAGFKIASPIQSLAIPIVQLGEDLIAQAYTGTGKTAAFGLPIMDKIGEKDYLAGLVITPTRELANQVSEELFKLGRFKGIRTSAIYGGESYRRQLDRIKRGAHILIATPGRLLDMLKDGKIHNFNPRFVVLDEADEMLDMGFLEDVKSIFSFLPAQRQTLMFSATMSEPIKKLSKTILTKYNFVSVTKKEATTRENIKQEYYVIEEHERDDALTRLLDAYEAKKTIIFCRMKVEVDRVATMLMSRGYSAKGLHGDMEQRQRDEAIRSFKKGGIDTLIATDVAARGLDINDVTHVFNYHIPFNPESYVHRIGRTGRADKSGTAITLVTPMEFRELQRIKKSVGSKMEQANIPTIQEVRYGAINKITESVKHQHIEEKAIEIVTKLEEDIDIAQICYKLASMVLENKKVGGPEKIGIDAQKLKRLLDNQHKNDRNKRGGGGRGRGYRGGGGGRGRNDGGGGRGYRGSGGGRSGESKGRRY
jgi:ATP-dependent RNA helicase DeaD